MQLPPTAPETLFEELLQDLPPETVPLARELKACARARKIPTPEQLLRVVLWSCGVEKAVREVAGTLTALSEPMTDQAVAARRARRRVVPSSVSLCPTSPEQHRTHDPGARQPWMAPVTRTASSHGTGVCVLRSALSDPDRSGHTGHTAVSAPAVPTVGGDTQETLFPHVGQGPHVA
jgi:hypothetical protein